MTDFERKDDGSHEPELRDLEAKKDEQAGHAESADEQVKGGRKAGGGQQDYLIVKMNDAIISG